MGAALAALRAPDGRRLTPPGANDRPKGLNVLGTLAHHPELARAYHTLTAHLLYKNTLTPRHRELVILRVAAVRHSPYEWAQHAVLAGDVGISEEELDRVAMGTTEGWSPLEGAMLRAVDELIADAVIADDTWAAVAGELDEKQLMDLVFTVASYDALAMLLRSFGTQLDDDLQRYGNGLLDSGDR